jgi:hypothetical protein
MARNHTTSICRSSTSIWNRIFRSPFALKSGLAYDVRMAVFLHLITILLLCIPTISSAFAAGAKPLVFSSSHYDLRTRQIASFLKDSGSLLPGTRIETAPIDLNGDGVNEVIFRQTNGTCEYDSDCPYIITGISNRQPAIIATFHGRKIGISGEKSYGIHNILVYNQKRNDFQYITYSWNPFTSSFQPQ